MPELPSVEIFKRYFDQHALNQVIKKVEVCSPELVVDVNPRKLEISLEGQEFVSSRRYGKYLFSRLDNDFYLIMHFGMTGYLYYFQEKSSKYVRLLVSFQNGSHLAFDDARKFGKLGLTSDPEEFIARKGLGEDALEIEFKTFQELFKNRRGMIKPLLLNQNFIAGIGNLYADEILYQCGLHPETHADQLGKTDLHTLYYQMRRVLEKAIQYQDSPRDFPDSYLLSHRYPGGECPEGGALEVKKVGGRTTYYCPERQTLR
ncbi:Fpg/Nei family DNA glycosylase [Methanobacterium sp. CWC-01]|uniref:Fpg/Nei family DNA glycosylase n=1 Tax=Methanobacterium aridiramus TaxID=2584467 RepID=UPI00257923C4|nr:DNA-formamidopyrimidine glycosylase family protein [Methanobacterium sp. CWC-01]WJI09982.1 Fpg/Nei family DNA glycosylase [Methanobacterium sp. CWC-01]